MEATKVVRSPQLKKVFTKVLVNACHYKTRKNESYIFTDYMGKHSFEIHLKKIATVKSNKPVYCKGNTTMGKPESLKFD